jgi:hypothetical protein
VQVVVLGLQAVLVLGMYLLDILPLVQPLVLLALLSLLEDMALLGLQVVQLLEL